MLRLFAALTLLTAPTAWAGTPWVDVQEVYGGSNANPDVQYVLITVDPAWENSRTALAGSTAEFRDRSAAITQTTAATTADITWALPDYLIIATPEAEAAFGVTADIAIASGAVDREGGSLTLNLLGLSVRGGVFMWGTLDGAAPTNAALPEGEALIWNEDVTAPSYALGAPSLGDASSEGEGEGDGGADDEVGCTCHTASGATTSGAAIGGLALALFTLGHRRRR